MRKHFLLLLWLTMLPLALWAAAPSAVTGLKYTGSAQTVAHAGSDWGQQYAYAIVQGTSTTKPNWYSASTSVPTATNAGTYTIWWAQRNGSAVNQSTWNSSNNHFTVTIDKAETTVSLYQVVKMWRGAAVWSDPSVDDLTASSYSLSAGSWSDIKGYLSWNQLQAVTDVGSYKYTLTAAEHPNYIIHIDGTAAELKVEPNDTRHWAQTATDGPNLQYNGSEQSLEPTDVPIFEDNDGYEAGTIEYSLDGSTWTAEYPKATDANVYTVTYRGVSNINHTEFTTTGSYNVEIEKIDATLAVTLDPTTYVYSPTLTVAPGYTSNNEETGGTVTYEYSFNGGFYTPTFTPEVGDWKVIAIQAETANYNETISAALDFTVTAPEIEEGWLTWTDNSDYDATDQLGTIEAGITILDGTDSTPLVLGTDYTIAIMKGGSAVTDVTNAGEYTFTFTGVGNYDGQFSKTFTMNKVAWVTVSDPVLAADWEYDGAEHALIDTEAAAAGYGTDVLDPAEIVYYLDDTATDLADLKVKNANEDPGYKVSFSINETENYLAVDKADLAPVFVTKKGLVITGASIAEVYKEPKWTFTKNQLFVVNDDDFVGDDKLLSADEQQTLVAGLITTTLTGVGDDILVTDVTPGLDRGAYTIHLADAAADVKNYKIKNLTDGGLNIEQAPNKFNNLEVADWTYGEAANAPVYDVDFKADDEPTFTYAVQGTTEFGTYEEIVNDQAGKYTVKAVVEQTNNYLKAEETADFEIKQAPLAITVKAQTKVYGEDDPELVLEADPAYQFTDDAETIGLTITRAEGEDVGTYAITAAVDADKAKNYDVTITNSTLEITKAPLAITIVDAEKVYGDADPEFTLDPAPEYQFEDNAETIGLVISREAGEDVGTYNITASYDTDKAKNYEITVTDATFEITAAELTIAVADATKVYGEEDPEFTLAEEPAYQNGDDATTIGLTYSREAGEDVGEYIISADATGAAASNYTITFTTGTLEITKAPLTLTAKALTKVYGEADPELILAEEPAYQWSDDAAAIGLTITREEGENVGTYTITPAATSENYEYTIVEADFEITPASLVYTLGNFTYPYTGEAYIPVEGESFVKTEGKLFFEDAYGKTFTFAWPDEAEVKDAGDYSFNKLQVNWAEGQSENYYIIFSETAKITVTPAEIAFTPAVAFEGLTYSGEAQTLIETPATAKFTDYEGNEIEFAIEYNVDGGEFSADLPEGTDAREYTVSTKVIADDNFVPVEAEDITVTIAPKAMTFDLAFEDAEWTYDGVAVEIEDLVAYDGEKALEKDVDYTLTITKDDEAFEGAMVNAGKYVYTYAGIEKSNYEGSSAEVTITINPASLEGIKVELSKTETDYNAEDQKPTYTLTYEPEGKPALTLVEGTDFEVAAEEKFINAGDYTFTFTGKGNYADENSADFTINKLELIAKVPAAKKTYDGTNAVENDEFGEFAYSGLIAGDHVDLGTATISDFVIVPEDAINVGEYELAIKDVAMFPEQQNYYVGSALPGTLTIEPAAPVTIAFTAAAKYSKEYASEDALEVVADDLMAAEGEFFDEFAEIADQLAISREEGEDVGTYDVELALAEGATFQNNYKEVKFAVGADKFEITPFATELKVSIADASVVYNGEVPTYDWAEDLSNMVVTNLPEGKDKSDIFTTLPTITIKDAAAAAGEYNLSIEGGESKNYKFKLLPGSYFTIEQFDLANATVTIPTQQAKVGQKAYTDEDGEGVINVTNFTIEDLPLATDIDGFVLEVGDGFIDGDGNIAAGADYKKGLVLVAADDDIAANYTGWENGEFTGNLIVEGGSELVLDDSETVSLSESAGAVNVTFTARGINSNSWNALVLPFDVTPSQLSDAFGYAAVDVLNENNDIEGEVHFNLITTGTIKAGTPFVFKPGEDTEGNLVANFTDVTFTGVQVKKEADYLANTTVTDAVGNKFIGTFEEITFTGAQYWYMSKGKWYDASEREVTLKPLRAYAEIANPKAGARFFFEEADGTVTAIDAISFNKANVEGMYNLSGMKVNNTNRKGVVIMNGKKVVK